MQRIVAATGLPHRAGSVAAALEGCMRSFRRRTCVGWQAMVGLEVDEETTRQGLSIHALGSIRVTRGGLEQRLGGPRQRRLLAVLLIHHDTVVPVDRVADAVFAG